MRDKNLVWIQKEWALFIGQLNDNQLHKHYAIQVSIPLQDDLNLIDEAGKKVLIQKPYIIPSYSPHRMECEGLQIILLVNPMFFHFTESNYLKWGEKIQEKTLHFLDQKITYVDFEKNIQEFLNQTFTINQNAFVGLDDRIIQSLLYIDQHIDRVVSLPEVAAHVCLSSGRFIHLFKDELGITFRQAQLWKRLVASISFLGKQTITETAHYFGFSDSAHYSRSFSQNFGLSPQKIIKNSQFIQV